VSFAVRVLCVVTSDIAMWRLLAAVASFTVGWAAADTTPSPCGVYSGCTGLANLGVSVQDNVTMTGYLSGIIDRTVRVVTNSSAGGDVCAQVPADYQYQVTGGLWQDLGPFASDMSDRKVMITYSAGISVTPLTQAGVDYLNEADKCPCTANFWQVGRAQALNCDASCDTCPCQCTDNCTTTPFGGTTVDENHEGIYPGYAIGAPAYSTMVLSADGGVQFSRLDADPTDGFNTTDNVPGDYSTVAAQELCTQQQQDSVCGSYMSQCRVVVDSTGSILESYRETFTSRGPDGFINISCTDGATQECNTAWGVYNRSIIVYNGDTCLGNVTATVTEEGTFGNLGRAVLGGSIDSGPYAYGRIPRSTTVTPMTASMLATFNTHCPCAVDGANQVNWDLRSPRQLTTCPENSGQSTCNMSVFQWYQGASFGGSFGVPVFAVGQSNTTQIAPALPVKMLAFSDWTIDYTGLNMMALAWGFEDTGAACTNGADQEFCGTYQSKCMAQLDPVADTQYPQNTQLYVIISGQGTTDGAADGQIDYAKSYYNNTGSVSPCGSDQTLTVEATGYYSAQDMPQNPNVDVGTGYEQILVEYSRLEVTPYTGEWVEYLQTNCPCANGDLGGQWTLGQTRILTYCGEGTMNQRPCEPLFQNGIFPGGSLTTAGYGTIQKTGNQMRLSPLVDSASLGPNQVMEATTTVVNQVIPCSTPQAFPSVCGAYYLPCHSLATDGQSTAHLAASGSFMATSQRENCSECFYMNTTYFSDVTGCEDNSPSYYLTIEQAGHYGIAGRARNAVVNGNNIQVTSQVFDVTPLSDEATNVLLALCPCPSGGGGPWQTNIVRHLNATCPVSECNYSVIQQQMGGGRQFAAFQHLGTTLRFTTFKPSQAGWSQASLVAGDFQFASITSNCNQTLPIEPSGKNPHPSPAPSSGGGGSKAMTGGDVFILILFLTVIVYFGGGMAFNFQRTGGFKNGGTPVIPHVQFWRGIPSLIADGCHYTITERCGTRSGGAAYASFGGQDPDFGNRSSAGSSGYGAL